MGDGGRERLNGGELWCQEQGGGWGGGVWGGGWGVVKAKNLEKVQRENVNPDRPR